MNETSNHGSDHRLRTAFLIAVIVSLSASALAAIVLVLANRTLGDTGAKVFNSTLVVGGYSIACLVSTILKERGRYIALSVAGLIFAVVGATFALVTIWGELEIEYIWWAMRIGIVSLILTHKSLVLYVIADTNALKILQAATLLSGGFLGILLLWFTWADVQEGDFIFRLIGVAAILTVLGTILIPVLKRLKV